MTSRPLFPLALRALASLAALVAFATGAAGQTPGTTAPVDCDALVAQGVAHARAGDASTAERLLRSAAEACPDRPGPYRELAGLRLIQQRWAESATFAEQAVGRDGSDVHAWEVMAASRYAAGDLVGALDAWNRQRQPAIDAVRVDGLERTPERIVADALRLQPGSLLTRGVFVRAARRLDDLPTSTASALTYTSEDGRTARVLAHVDERSHFPTGYIGWGTVGLLAAITREIAVDLAGPLRIGDSWEPAFRWPRERRRLGLALALPTPFTHRGIVRVEGSWERETYAVAGARIEEMRRKLAASHTDWITSAMRLESRVAVDRIDRRTYVAVGAGATMRWPSDRLVAHVRVDHWIPTAAGRHATGADVVLDWRSTTNQRGPHWTSRLGVTTVTEQAPLALWPGAGSILNRTALLRGRELVRRNVLSGEAFGRQLAFATIERRHPLFEVPIARVALAGFADAARAWHRPDGTGSSRLHVDVGAGLRVAQTGDRSEARLDVGVGLRDGSVRVSAGYLAAWGRR